jgi:MFS family permease
VRRRTVGDELGDVVSSTLPEPEDVRVASTDAQTDATGATVHDLPRVPAWRIALLVLATFGGGMAAIVPMSYSLAVRLDQIAPGRTDLLGVLLAIGSAATLVAAPLAGILSDRTRSRWGRRRPFTVIGAVIGAAAVFVMAFAPNIPVLAIGWVLSTVGWNTAGGSIGNWQADRLPPSQRGQVSGITTLTMHVAPVVGILLVTPVAGASLPIFLIPAAVAVVLIAGFVVFVHDPDSRHLVHADRLTLGKIVRSYGFRPREFPDFAWNWAGRFVFFLGLSLTTSFTVFFYAQRLGIPVGEVAGFMALTSGMSVAASLLGALGGGWLSDRIRRRRPLILVGTLLFVAGSVVSAFAYSVAALIVGTVVTSLGIALFSAAGQALTLDILPHRDTQAGRFMAINLFAQKIPGVIAPLAAGVILATTATQNFVALYLTAAALTLIGGLIVTTMVRTVR